MPKVWAVATFAILFAACTAADSDSSPNEIVGADRDANGCIPSAGYQWSALQEECIRVWEAGTELTHQGSGDPNYSAYVILSEGKAEIFLPETSESVMLSRDTDVGDKLSWSNEEADYQLSYDESAALILTDMGGFVMYRDMSSEPTFDNVPEHSYDEIGGELLTDVGVVSRVEDGPYPMFTLHVRLDGDEDETLFSLMSEGAEITGATVYELEGRDATLTYVDKTRWDLMTIQPMDSDQSDDIEIGVDWRAVSGRLSDAEAVSGGDLPDELTISLIDGEVVTFDYFIDEEMVAMNDTDISAWLAPTQVREIVAVHVDP